MVHATIWESAQVSRLSRDARLTYIGLIVLGDDDGRLKADPRLIKSQIYPYDDEVKLSDIEKWMGEIKAQNLVVEYEVEGVRYMYHPKWENYQQLREDRRRESNIPAPDIEFSVVPTKRQPSVNQKGDKPPRKISKDKISKDNTDLLADSAFVVFWDKYPKKVGRKAAFKAWHKVEWTPDLVSKAMTALEAWKQSEQWTKDAGRYIPHAATWVNGERWEDEVKTVASKSTKYAGTTTKTVRG